MTEHKARKSLVRQRMAQTGESYSTALRHVTTQRHDTDQPHNTDQRHGTDQRAAAPIPGLVAGYPAFGAQYHRPSALSRHLLAQAGLDISEPIACGLGGGIGFLYAIFEYVGLPAPLLTIVAQHHPQPWFEAVTTHLGAATTTLTSSSPRTALAKLDAALDAGRPALIVTGRGLLPWYGELSEWEAANAHPVVVAGRVDDDYLIDDRSQEPQHIDRDTLGAAWAAHRKSRFALTTVTALPDRVDLPAAIRAALITTTDHLTGPVLGHYFDANMGLRGMAKFVAELRDSRTKTGWARRFPTDEALSAALRRLAECLTTQYTAVGGTRPLYARFLTEAADVTDLDLLPAAEYARLSGQIWTQLADLAERASRSGEIEDPAALRGQIADLAETAVDTETVLVQHIRSAMR